MSIEIYKIPRFYFKQLNEINWNIFLRFIRNGSGTLKFPYKFTRPIHIAESVAPVIVCCRINQNFFFYAIIRKKKRLLHALFRPPPQ